MMQKPRLSAALSGGSNYEVGPPVEFDERTIARIGGGARACSMIAVEKTTGE